jgi:carbon-monoxide dehydrogenase large subunit
VYDGSSGQFLSASFMDYALPRADDFPSIVSECDEGQPCSHNPLGAKGCGEAGSIAAPAAIVGAVLDALAPLGVRDVDMPLTPARLWGAIRKAGPHGGFSGESSARIRSSLAIRSTSFYPTLKHREET